MSSLAQALFSGTQQAVLALLYGNPAEAFYLRQITRAADIGVGSVQRELKSLTTAGIISRNQTGKQVYYQANPACPIFDEIKGIVTKTFGIADIVRNALLPLEGRLRL